VAHQDIFYEWVHGGDELPMWLRWAFFFSSPFSLSSPWKCRMCAALRRSSSTLNYVCVSGKYEEKRNSCLLLVEKNGMGVAT
jgi:hypothetical protein